MPLIKSKSDKAFKSNIKAEVKAGKPVKQAVAIAYSTKRAAKKAHGGDVTWEDIDEPRPSYGRSTNPHDYDSDIDYYKAIGDPRGDDDDEVDTATRMSNAKKFKGQKLLKKISANRKMADIAKASGNKEEAEKQWGRLERRGDSTRLKQVAEYFDSRFNKPKAQAARKEWSEKVGKGKPAPFKAGGKAKVCW
jgi:hypothetical protein